MRSRVRRASLRRIVASVRDAETLDIRPLDTVESVFAASAVLSQVWGGDRTGMPANLLRALAHSGNYAFGVYDGDRMVGASVAFFGPPADAVLHSHITGLLPEHRGRGGGRTLKLHQRAWALERGVQRISWTFDRLWPATRISTCRSSAPVSPSISSTTTGGWTTA